MRASLLKLLALPLVVGLLAGCMGTGKTSGHTAEGFLAERPYVYWGGGPYADPHRYVPRGSGLLTLVNLNPSCDGMGLRFFIDPYSVYEPSVHHLVLDERGQPLRSGWTNVDGKTVIDFEGNRLVTLVIDEGLMWQMRTFRGAAPELMLGAYDHGRVLLRHGTVRLGTLLATGKQVVDFRGSTSFCG